MTWLHTCVFLRVRQFVARRLCRVGQQCIAARDYSHAVLSYQLALRISQGESDAYSTLWQLLFFLGDTQGCLALAESWLERHPGDHESHVLIAYLSMQEREWENAESHIQAALSIAPDSPEAMTCQATYHLRLSDFDRAQEEIELVLSRFPAHYNAMVLKAEFLVSQNRKAAAIPILLDVAEMEPDRPDAFVMLARMAYYTSYDHPHLVLLKRFIDEERDRPVRAMQAAFAMGEVCDALERWDEAYSFFACANHLDKRTYDQTIIETRVNLNIEFFTREIIQRAQNREYPTTGEELVFIVGMPRSGSSLLEQVLASHPGVYAAGEGRNLLQSVAAIPGQGRNLESYPIHLSQMPLENIESIAARLRADAVALSPGKNRFSDKTLDNCFDLGLLAMLFPKARILHCVRDPRDTCISIYFQNFNLLPYSNDLVTIGVYYNAYARVMEHWKGVLPTAPLDVVYEDLVVKPETHIKKILDFCGLQWDPNCLEFQRTTRPTFTASSYQVKLPFYQRSIGRWRHYEKHVGTLLDVLHGPNEYHASG